MGSQKKYSPTGCAISDVVLRYPPGLINVSDNVRGGNPRRNPWPLEENAPRGDALARPRRPGLEQYRPRLLHRLKVAREVPQQFRPCNDSMTTDGSSVLPDLFDDLDQVVEVALGVDAARKGQTNQFQG